MLLQETFYKKSLKSLISLALAVLILVSGSISTVVFATDDITDEETVEEIVYTPTQLQLDIQFRPASRFSADKSGGYADYSSTLLDENGEAIPNAYISYTQTTAAPGQRKTNEAGVAKGYGSFFYANDTYTVTATFKAAQVNGVYYDTSTVSKVFSVKKQCPPVINDDQVVAAYTNSTTGKIFGLDENLEYIEWIETIGVGQQLIPVTGNTVTGLKPTIYSFRYKQYWDEETQTLYVPSEYYQFAVPRADISIKPDTTNEHIIWGEVSTRGITNRDVTEAVLVSRTVNTYAYFNVKPELGYEITKFYFATADGESSKDYSENIEYNKVTGDLTVNGWNKGLGEFILSAEVESQFVVGDADNDGESNIKDATLVQKHIASITSLKNQNLYASDVDNDGEISIKDVTSIQKSIANITDNGIVGSKRSYSDSKLSKSYIR